MKLRYKGQVIRLKKCVGMDSIGDWYCSYTKKIDDSDECGSGYEITYDKKGEVGFDTAHLYNDKMTLDERREDAISQAKAYIDQRS